ncbi:MAG: outer membrane beta-barrel protein [Methylacidiphilales bacterium]|nr:outer membrane beta-barrel protein [Candidatus Methylacidiphilales bacterium]
MKKITLIFGSLVVALGLITSAHAGTDMKEIATTSPEKPANWYIGVFGGASFSQDYYGASSNFPSAVANTNISNDIGGLGGLKIGYKFDSFDLGGGFAIEPAVELEGAYIDATTPSSRSQNISMTGDLNSVAFGANGLVRFKTGTPFTPYVGLGIGGQWLQLSKVNFTSTTTIVPRVDPPPVTTTSQASAGNQSDLDFTFQGIVGFDYEVAHNWAIFTEYNYLVAVAPSFTFTNVGGTGNSYTYKDDLLGQNLITAGVRYSF